MNSLTPLENLIEHKSAIQARKEWGEFEELVHDWFKSNSAKNCHINRTPETSYQTGPLPMMRLCVSPRNPKLAGDLAEFAEKWVTERQKILLAQFANTLVEKAELLNSDGEESLTA